MPPANAALPRSDPSSPDTAVAVAPHRLEFPPPLAGPPLSSSSGNPRHGSELVPDTENDARTPGSAEFFLREPHESSDDNTPLAHTAITYEQQLQWKAQLLVSGDLKIGKPSAEQTMVHAFGGPAEGQKHEWQEEWCAAVNRWESQKSLVPGYDTPPSSSLSGSCTSQVPDVGSTRGLPEKHTEVLKQQNGEEAVKIFRTKAHVGGEVASQVPDVGSARGPPEKHTEVLKQQNGEEAVIISGPKQYAGGEEVRQGVGSARSHPLVNITEHYFNLALHDRGSETRSLSKKKPDPCVKCGKEGQLLKCRTCSLAAHGSCFGSSVTFDDSGLFNCPVCFFNKANEAYKKAKITRSEARKNLSTFRCSDKSVKQHNENQSVKQDNRPSEAANLSHKDEEPDHEKRNDVSDACPEATTFGPKNGDAKAQEVGSSSSCQESPHSSHKRFRPIADFYTEAGKENGLMNSPMTCSHRRGRRVRFHIKGTVVSRSYGKASGRQDQFMHSPARKRYYPQPPVCHSSPATLPARSPLGSTRRHGTSTANHKMTKWTKAEEAALREGMAKYLAGHPGAAAGIRNISWVRILDDCADSFNPGRQPSDLRTQWDRMKKHGRAL